MQSTDTKNPAGFTRRALLSGGALLGGGLLAVGGGAGLFIYRSNRVGDYPADAVHALHGSVHNPLTARFPELRAQLPWMPLARQATPVERLAPNSDIDALYVKRDDGNAALYGGNKVRKLEHLLAEARLQGADTLVTMGGIGSNQAVATSLLGREAGFSVELSLFDHPVSAMTGDNLRGCLAAGARIHFADGIAGALWNIHRIIARCQDEGRVPYFIPAGASNRLGNIGFVTAGLELAEQVAAGELPAPTRVFVGAGTCGTAAGLLVGLRLGGLDSRVVAVRTAEAFVANRLTLCSYARDSLRYLRGLSPQVPDITISEEDFLFDGDYLGDAYAVPTSAAHEAVAWAEPQLRLETTYTGKTLAAALDAVRQGPSDGPLLFWNTFNSRDFPKTDAMEALPAALRRRLETAGAFDTVSPGGEALA